MQWTVSRDRSAQVSFPCVQPAGTGRAPWCLLQGGWKPVASNWLSLGCGALHSCLGNRAAPPHSADRRPPPHCTLSPREGQVPPECPSWGSKLGSDATGSGTTEMGIAGTGTTGVETAGTETIGMGPGGEDSRGGDHRNGDRGMGTAGMGTRPSTW